jgi:hypothetical protein
MGYSLNQRGLFAGVVRSLEDRTIKTNAGELLNQVVLVLRFLFRFSLPRSPLAIERELAPDALTCDWPADLWCRLWLHRRRGWWSEGLSDMRAPGAL